jgi:small subunit ribosomal protein S6
VNGIEERRSAILSRKSDEHERDFRGPKPRIRSENGRRRTYGDREEYRARETFSEDLTMAPAPSSDVPEPAR